MGPEFKQHGMTTSKNGSATVISVTCPHILKLDIEAKNSFLHHYKICRSCLREPVGPDHDEEKCDFGKRYHVKCKEAMCNQHYLVCNLHRHLQENKILIKQEALRKAGIHCKF